MPAFGMARRPGRSAENGPGLMGILEPDVPCVCMVGKARDFHVDVALEIDHAENIRMIADSVALAKTRKDEVMFDAEHFFDGYKSNPAFALSCIQAAYDNGARWVVLCDTNGGTLPSEIAKIIKETLNTDLPKELKFIQCYDELKKSIP